MSTELESTIEPLTEREIAIAKGDAYLGVGSEVQSEHKESGSQPGDGGPTGDSGESAGKDSSSPGGKEAAQNTKADWLDEGLESYGKSLGLTDEQLQEFTSPEELYRAGMLFDRKAEGETQSPPGGESKGKESEGKSSESLEGKVETDEDGLIDVNYYKDNDYDDATINLVEALRKQQEETRDLRSYVDSQRQSEAQQAVYEAQRRFDKAVEKLYPDIYGKLPTDGSDPDPEVVKLRTEAWQAVAEVESKIYQEQVSRGVKPEDVVWPDDDTIVTRAAMKAHGEKILGRERKKVIDDLRDQQRRGRPATSRSTKGASQRPADGGTNEDQTLEEAASEIANDPVLAKFFEEHSS